MLKTAFSLAALATVCTLAPPDAHAEDKVRVAIVREFGVGSSAQAKRYVEKFAARIAKLNDWGSADAKYITDSSRVAGFKPHYGMMSLGAYLAWHDKATVVGVADVKNGGGQRYHLVSKSATDLGGCKGATLASNHVKSRNRKFVDKVVSGGAFSLSDFKLVETRPIQAVKKVINGEARCALIDDAQHAELSHVDGGAGLKTVWTSPQLPPMAIVAFSSVGSTDRAKFKASLGQVCSGEGQAFCQKVGVRSVRAATPSDEAAYAKLRKQYGN